jgi:ACR3 family arsenite efflux pump ArsB
MKQEKIKPENYYYRKSKSYYKITLSAFLFSLLMITIFNITKIEKNLLIDFMVAIPIFIIFLLALLGFSTT